MNTRAFEDLLDLESINGEDVQDVSLNVGLGHLVGFADRICDALDRCSSINGT